VVIAARRAYIEGREGIKGVDMTKRAVDLSLEELAAMGANAALRAVNEARDAGLVVTGTVDFLENGQAVSSLAERNPSGTVTLLEVKVGHRRSPTKSKTIKPTLRQKSTD
jgi:hypothetical protein